MGAECGKRLFKDDAAGSATILGNHLPSAESTGVAGVAAAGLNAGPVHELDLVAGNDIKGIARITLDGNGEILCVIFLSQLKVGLIDRDKTRVGIILFLVTMDNRELEVPEAEFLQTGAVR